LNKNIFWKSGSVTFTDEEFDFVLIVVTLCFVDDPEKVIEEAKRVLKKGGRIIVGIIDRNSKIGKSYQEKKEKLR